ncbi:mitochondrial 54S ribosomal protein mL60 KNAG_0A06160 [Huiozyma naganishii CBS 8797]|uniref:Large ribosomal subunit protein mL60 n=1 Tax=Huiozyma naganishii (strain ATCC MYA-139 / BCRC 22969 / CBS 8797 / KCTC 17520 / NBRC 10181 / NCYC 3082 / Yp74L-3) TaxID=1071383 RepID=J7RFE7_HUIN7|nr:hypothetical protein KNAG_0A06160 [Kazachstania naganishii CBS 8797]CCK68278.1 hypothetical protein KNAG_0A06160 [Kazachstania naganishii CBS 8797]
MLGPFRASSPAMGGLLWKIPWRMSAPQKRRQRSRLRSVDSVIEQVTLGLHVARCEEKGIGYEEAVAMPEKFQPRSKLLRLLNKPAYFPKESEMEPKNKYTVFDKKVRGYRKGIHKVPKWTKVSAQRTNRYF